MRERCFAVWVACRGAVVPVGRGYWSATLVRRQIGMAAQAIAGALDADDDGVMEEAIEQRRGDDGVTEHFGLPLTSSESP